MRADCFSTVPEKKLNQALRATLLNCQECSQIDNVQLSNSCTKCSYINKALIRFSESNIPFKYWNFKMSNFKGDASLVSLYNDTVEDLNKAYAEGLAFCLAGNHGSGKTTIVTSLLKHACTKGFSCLYVTLSDIVSVTVSGPTDEKFMARKDLLQVDFLVIDEFDSRYMPTGPAADLFGRTMEDVLRRRTENELPLFMCTNSPNVVDSFEGSIKHSLESLMNYIKIVPVISKDFRKGAK